jgi:hypothetical protein
MGYFQREAKKANWDKEKIKKVLNDCQSSDYNNLLQVLMSV